jgi:hypothetical protein
LEAGDVRHIEHKDGDQQYRNGYADYDDICDEGDSAAGEEMHAFLFSICVLVLEAK